MAHLRRMLVLLAAVCLLMLFTQAPGVAQQPDADAAANAPAVQPPDAPEADAPDADAPDTAHEPEHEARPAPPSRGELCGFDAADQRLGDKVPTGRRIVCGHVEARGNRYAPDAKKPDFADVDIQLASGESAVSGHATGTASVAYGRRGLAPGVTEVLAFSTEDWLGPGFLRAGSPLPPRNDLKVRVFNHSWVGPAGPGIEEILRRLDYVIDAQGVICCVGVNNQTRTALPGLLSQSYNAIAVGSCKPDGSPTSSHGYTTVEGDGRCKPDLVATPGLVSFTTPSVTAAVARLLEAADNEADLKVKAAAGRPQTIKALLMAGATKTDYWKPAKDKPLDEMVGAGMLNFDRTLAIREHGPATPDSPAPGNAPGNNSEENFRGGWSYNALTPLSNAVYAFELDKPASDVNVALAYHRRVDPAELRNLRTGQRTWLGLPYATRFRLELVKIDDPANPVVLATSDSDVDNVQYIHLPTLAPGRYSLAVFRYADPGHPEPWDYALAWRMDVQ